MYNKEVQGIVIWYVSWNQDKARDKEFKLTRGNSYLSMNTVQTGTTQKGVCKWVRSSLVVS